MQQSRLRNRPWLNSNWMFLGLLAAVAILIWGTLRSGQTWGDDFASYIMQAQSILSGSIPEFIQQNRFTVQESSILIGPVAYPWGTAVLLAPILYLKGFDIQALKSLNIICFLCFLALLWFGLKKDFSPGWGCCISRYLHSILP